MYVTIPTTTTNRENRSRYRYTFIRYAIQKYLAGDVCDDHPAGTVRACWEFPLGVPRVFTRGVVPGLEIHRAVAPAAVAQGFQTVSGLGLLFN